MKHFATLICLFLLAENALAQVNLVPNGSFENHSICPVNNYNFSNFCDNWTFNIGSPDYYHRCSSGTASLPINIYGYQDTPDSAYMGLGCYGNWANGLQESAKVELVQPLIAGTKYRVRMKISYGDSANYAICCLGVILSSSSPPGGPYLQNLSSVELIIPEADFDTTSWFQLDTVYTAQGGEDKLFIGAFRPESEMNVVHVIPNGIHYWDVAYFLIDDVEVYEDNLVGIEEENLDIKLTSELVSEQLEITADKPVQLNLMDISGRMVLSEPLSSASSSVSVSSIPNGMYVAVFTSENGQTTSKKILKVN